jgi:hypothetical protein
MKAATVDFDFADVMERVQRVIKAVAPHDSAERYRGSASNASTAKRRSSRRGRSK